jgi:hypothetical protein
MGWAECNANATTFTPSDIDSLFLYISFSHLTFPLPQITVDTYY